MENIIPCGNCSAEFSTLNCFICPKCEYLNPLQQVDYFTYLGLNKTFHIDLIELENNYLVLMQLYHPDKYASKTGQEQSNALIHSSFLNTIYNTIKDPLLRLGYLYELFNDGPILNDNNILNDPKISMEFFTWYEKIAEANNREELDILYENLLSLKQELFNNIDELDFIKNKDLVQDMYIKIRYIDRIVEKINSKKNLL